MEIIKFQDVKEGEIFSDAGTKYIKVKGHRDPSDWFYANACCLDDGSLVEIEWFSEVIKEEANNE